MDVRSRVGRPRTNVLVALGFAAMLFWIGWTVLAADRGAPTTTLGSRAGSDFPVTLWADRSGLHAWERAGANNAAQVRALAEHPWIAVPPGTVVRETERDGTEVRLDVLTGENAGRSGWL